MIVAIAFGRQINVQRGESDEFSKAMDTAVKGFADGLFENFTLIHSMHKWQLKCTYKSVSILDNFKLGTH